MLNGCYIVGPRGECICKRDYTGLNRKYAIENLVTYIKQNSPCDPILVFEDGVFVYLIKNKVIFALEFKNKNFSFILGVELLAFLYSCINNFLGVITEKNIKQNFTFANEIIDELYVNGYYSNIKIEDLSSVITSCTTNENFAVLNQISNFIKDYAPNIIKDKIIDTNINTNSLIHKLANSTGTRNISAYASELPLLDVNCDNVFIDIIDKISCDIDLNDGNYSRLSAIGSINLKNYIRSEQNYLMGLSQNIDLKFVQQDISASTNKVKKKVNIINILFNDVVDYSQFKDKSILKFKPVLGDMVIAKYKCLCDKLPISFQSNIRFINETTASVSIRIKQLTDRLLTGSFSISMLLPQWVYSCKCKPLNSQINTNSSGINNVNKYETYSIRDNKIFWENTNLQLKSCIMGQQEGFCVIFNINKRTVDSNIYNIFKNKVDRDLKLLLGPVQLSFNINMYSCSNLHVKFLRSENNFNTIKKWAKYNTVSNTVIGHFI